MYDAFGNVESSSGSWTEAFGYGGPYGYQSASEGGLMLLGHRYYDPSTGRFLTRDPIKDGRNWYGYCYAEPLGYFDDDGNSKKKVRHPNSTKHRPAGPSGKPKRHIIHHPSRGRAEEAALRESAKGKAPIEHDRHFHPQGPKGEKLPQHHAWWELLPWEDIGKGVVIAGGLIVVGGAVVLTGGSAALPLAAAGGAAIVFLPGSRRGGF